MSFNWGLFSHKQLEVIANSTARMNILDGSVRSGKTISSLVTWIMFVSEAPPGELLMAGKTERTLKRNILDVLEQMVGQRYFKYSLGSGEATLFGRRIYLVGANDMRSEGKIRGLTLAGAYGDEITLWPESFFTMLLSRLSISGAKFIGTTNPDSPYHWLMRNYLRRVSELDLKRWHFSLEDNPNLDQKYVEALKREYTGLWYKRYILGQWVQAEGVVYDMWDESKYVRPTIDRPYTQYYVSIDYGTQNPMAFGLWGYVPPSTKANPHEFESAWYKIKEYHYDGRAKGRQKTDEEYYHDLVEFVGELPIRSVIIDPSAASFIATIRKRGKFTVRKAHNDVLEGIRNVATALNTGKILYNDCCKETFREFASYVWDEKAAERGGERPVKQNDHQLDADRYFVNTVVMRPAAVSFD